MKQWIKALRNLFKKGRNNLIKILSLSVGLAIGSVLFTKVYFENNYDDFYPDSERIYKVISKYKSPDQEAIEYGQTPGGIAPGLKLEIPEIAAATRFTGVTSPDAVFYTEQKKTLTGRFILADSSLFDILPRPMLIGNAKETLSRPMHVLVSREIAEKIGHINEVIGQTLEIDSRRGKILTIGGVFENQPENSHLKTMFDIIISMPSISNFTWDGSNNWLGNDRYSSYIKLHPNTDIDKLRPAIRGVLERNIDMEELKKSNVEIDFLPVPITQVHISDPENKRMNILLSFLAFAVLFTAIVNYILIVISSLINRSREVAIYKCYGASLKNIRTTMLIETAVDVIVSVIVATLLIFLFKGTIQEILNNSISAIFSGSNLVIVLLVSLFTYFITGYIPANLFAKIPIAAAFRSFKSSRRSWKLALLFIQITATAFLLSMLVIGVSRQYQMMINNDPGYKYHSRAYCNLSGISKVDFNRAKEAVKRLPEVGMASSCYQLPFEYANGNNVVSTINGEPRELFNIADFYDTEANYLSFFDIPIVSGQGFIDEETGRDEIIISESFAKKVAETLGWTDGVLGKPLEITEHNWVQKGEEWERRSHTIRGVYRDFLIGSIQHNDARPSVMFYSASVSSSMLIKFKNYSGEALYKVSQTLEEVLPDKHIAVIPMEESILNSYNDSNMFRKVVGIGSIVALIIALIGLIGYASDEVNRRSTELAIRKVNGARIRDILLLFMKDISIVALPGILIGGIVAHYAIQKFLESFVLKVSLPFYLYLLCGLGVYLIVLGVTALRCLRSARENPINHLKSL